MTQIQTATKFSLWALEFALYPLLGMTVVLTLVLPAISAWTARRQRLSGSVWKPHHWGALTHLLLFPAAIAVGVLLPASSSAVHGLSPNRVGVASLKIVFYVSVVSCVFWIWKMRGLRWVASGLMTLMELPVLGALFVAGMSVTGDWL